MHLTENEIKSMSLVIDFVNGTIDCATCNDEDFEKYTFATEDLQRVLKRYLTELKLKKLNEVRKGRKNRKKQK